MTASNSTRMRWSWSSDLDVGTLYAVLKLRAEVFVIEQDCTYLDIDGRDLDSGTRHFWTEGHGGHLLSYLRLLGEADGGYSIGRVCTAASARGCGYAGQLVLAALDEIGAARCRMNAQAHLVDMYGKLGFVVAGDEFLIDDIPHVLMERAA